MTQSQWFALCAWRGAIKLESVGLKHSSGRSVTAHVKRQLGITGNRDKVLAKLQDIISAGPDQPWPGKG